MKAIAKTLLMTAVNQTPYSPMLVQHPFTSTGSVALPSEKYAGFRPIDITLNNENLQRWQESVSGVEVSEGFWYNREYEKIHSMLPYDVILGSVHFVKYKDLEMPYSGIDFSRFTNEQIYSYMDCYFNDMLEMIGTTDFDIMAHMTCPLRYITGKYGIKVDLSVFDGKITEILKEIIHKHIALEVNTSGYVSLNESMPNKEILKKYFDMGGYLITLGSDAHIAENASYCFDKAIDTLKEIGFKNIYYYKNREAHQINI